MELVVFLFRSPFFRAFPARNTVVFRVRWVLTSNRSTSIAGVFCSFIWNSVFVFPENYSRILTHRNVSVHQGACCFLGHLHRLLFCQSCRENILLRKKATHFCFCEELCLLIYVTVCSAPNSWQIKELLFSHLSLSSFVQSWWKVTVRICHISCEVAGASTCLLPM